MKGKKMTKVKRIDIGELFAWDTKEGYIEGQAIVTRTGVFKYLNNDGSVRGELRHPEDVFDRMSVDSMKMIPITNDHPKDLVNSKNSKIVSVGYVGENVTIDGTIISVPFKITDEKAISDVRNGKNQLSLGYETVLTNESGEWEGEKYDARQKEIEYNHLAIVDGARAGEIAKIHLDNKMSMDFELLNKGKIKTKKKGSKSMATVKIDGLSYDEQAPEVANYIDKLESTKLDNMKKIDELEKSLSKVEADRDDAKDKLKKLDSRDLQAEIEEAVSSRLDTIEIAKKVSDKLEFEGKTELDIKKDTIIAKYDGANLDEKDEVYIQGRFDAIKADIDKEGINGQRRDSADNNFGKQEDNSKSDRLDMKNRRRGLMKGDK